MRWEIREIVVQLSLCTLWEKNQLSNHGCSTKETHHRTGAGISLVYSGTYGNLVRERTIILS